MDKNDLDIAERLFAMACCGDIENLRTFYKITGSLNITYQKFGEEHSLLMGAFRNRQWEAVRWLLDHGAKPTAAEQREVNDRFLEIAFIQEMRTASLGSNNLVP